MRQFTNGREMCRAFYDEILAPQLAGIPHDAVMIGEGSDVQGYDQMISRDHRWGPRAVIFTEDDCSPELSLPDDFCGISVLKENFCVTTLEKWLSENLGICDISNIPTEKWLSMPQQLILQFVSGMQLGGSLGVYTRACDALAWYPDDVWRWILASQWYLIWSEERLIPRTLDAGDKTGSLMIAHRLLRYIFQLHFLHCRRYQPYDKWFGTAFHSLPGSGFYEEKFREACAKDGDELIAALHSMLLRLGEEHNSLGLTRHVTPRICSYEVGIDNAVRPYKIINASDFIDALKDSMSDAAIRELPNVGGIDQLGNTTDLMINFSHWKPVFENGYRVGLNR